MPIIHRPESDPTTEPFVVLDLADLEAQATRIRAAAREQASRILRDAEQLATRTARLARDQARQQGYAEGYDRGLAEGRGEGFAQAHREAAEQVEHATHLWQRVLDDLETVTATVDREAREAVVRMAMRLAEMVLHREIERDPSVVVDQVEHALSFVMRAAAVTIRVNPRDRPVLEEALPQVKARLAGLEHVRIEGDPAIERGGCVVTTGQGRIDAALDTQLARLAEMLVPDARPTTTAAGRTPADHPKHSSEHGIAQPPP